MLLTEAEYVFLVFILYISGVQGRSNRMCILEGSSVELLCSAEHTTNKWYTVNWDGYKYVQHELTADEGRVVYNMSAEGQPTLTISNLRESDSKSYCCRESNTPLLCQLHRTELHVADLQVKVIPTTDGQTVTLMCSTSCALTETPAAYIWYKNREFLYEDWSPWYQELVGSEEGVTYSCAIKGYEDLRAPDVSVDSVKPNCVNVTYAKGRMCSHQNESCSVTYPKEVLLQRTPSDSHLVIKLTCTTSCSPPALQTTYMWYRNRCRYFRGLDSLSTQMSSMDSYSCAVKGLEHLHSAEACAEANNCWSVNYVSRRLCALKGSSVNISCEASHPRDDEPKFKFWYKIKTSDEDLAEKVVEDGVRVQCHSNKDQHILTLDNLKEEDSAQYTFRLKAKERFEWSDLPGVTLAVTGLKVTFSPSSVVAEGQRVKLTCSTSCPLPPNTSYIWYLNARPLLPNQSKHLVLDPVSSQHAGRYTCAVQTKNVTSSEEVLTVQSKAGVWTLAAAAGLVAVLLVIIPLTVFLWSRKQASSSQPPTPERCDNRDELKTGRANKAIAAQQAEDELLYSTVSFKNHTDPLYSSNQPRQPGEQDQVLYAAVNFRQKNKL
ncbi:contactin-1-like [Channa argus]|uniref:contactin-1-like n=1 Tax=Channa argus TaxID=215402 RepID=UPI0035210191